jgi:hypothetical protein
MQRDLAVPVGQLPAHQADTTRLGVEHRPGCTLLTRTLDEALPQPSP